MSKPIWDAYNRRWIAAPLSDMRQDRDRWQSETARLNAEIKVLMERLIQAQNDGAKWRERAIEADAERIAREYQCLNCGRGVDA